MSEPCSPTALRARRRVKMRRAAMLWLWMVASGLCALGGEARFTAILDRESIVLGEPVALTLQFEGGSPRGVPSLPPIPGLQVAQGITTSMNSSVGPDGTMTTVQSYILNLLPQRVGEFSIPSLTAEVDGQVLHSQPLQLKVVQSDPAAPTPALGERLAFISLTLPKNEAFVGEVLIAELRLYVRGDVRNISEVQLPSLGGADFTSSKFIEGKRFQRRVGNTPFTIIPLLAALTPLKSGTLPIGPLNGSLVVHVTAARGRNLDPFNLDGFFGPATEPRRVPLEAPAQELAVLPLPTEQVPPGFAGAVGSYTLAFSAGPTNVAEGQPITVKIQITGQGAIDALTLPSLDSWKGFKAYPPTSKVETRDQFGIQGTKFFEQVVVPQSTEITELPAFAFSFFDPDRKSYRTLSQPPTPLVVRPGGSAAAPTMVTTVRGGRDHTPPAQDIVPIKQRLGTLAQIGSPLVQRPWFAALQAVPILALLSAAAWRRHTDCLANNPLLRRRRQAAQALRKDLGLLHRFAVANQPVDFFATLVRILQDQLGAHLDLPSSAITESVIEERLRPAGVPEPTLTALQQLFQTCNQARYAPVQTSQELAALIPKLQEVLNHLKV